MQQLPLTRDLVLIGGGHAHALVLRMWGMRPLPGARLTLISPGPTAAYSGMLPGHIAGHYPRAALDLDLVRLARFAGARLVLGAAEGIDPAAGWVEVAGRGRIAYDVASLNVGVIAGLPDLPGFADHAVGARPLDLYADAWAEFVAQVEAGAVPAEIAVIGGGVAGVELALASAHRLRAHGPKVTLIEAGPGLLPGNPAMARRLVPALGQAGVTVLAGAALAGIGPDAVLLADGRAVPARFTVAATGARAQGWLAGTLPVSADGSVRVGADLRVEGQDNLFAAGDCAHLVHAPRPKAGVFAVRAAPVLRDNLEAVLTGRPTRPFAPQKDYLKLVSLGSRRALAEKWGRVAAGPGLWRWKDRIDRKFMRMFAELPAMAPRLPARMALGREPGSKPLCGGCGSKVGAGTLAGALAALPQAHRSDVITGAGDDAAVLEIGGVRQVLTTDHLRGFILDWGLMARITAVHALGDIWSMGAAPQAALVSVTLPRMSETLAARSMAEIMAAMAAVLEDAGAEIVGGHSTMGAELTLGLTLTGLCERPITQAGARPGDVLILTRPVGSGVILAAEMQGRAGGKEVAALLARMATPQGDAAAILAGARAMTDVTGFGLAGHLWAIARASGAALVIDPARIPLYDGALRLAGQGVRSSIFAANAAAHPVFGAEGPLGDLLHDPQTAGGLLAAVGADEAEGLLAQLCAAGHQAAIIGRVEAGPPSLRAEAGSCENNGDNPLTLDQMTR